MRGLPRVKRVLNKLKSLATLRYISFPDLVQCNLCGWKGRRFLSDSWHPYSVCPRCHSEVRHRLLIASLTYIEGISYEVICQNKQMLHFAPELMIQSILQQYAAKYVTADFLRQNVDLRLDISNMVALKDNEFDLVIACDVLEHVPNDIKAMQEIHRILRKGAYAILTVPQKDFLEETFEDPTVIDPQIRTHLFGQFDHLRIYGDNFQKILESVGFQVKVINESNFPNEIVKKYVLFPPILSDKPLATNYRKVFFAQKI